uniref:Uncharacterized protein n=1 Tax=Arundo donax TaxID=35708 RepID=A0A0A8Y0V0_ARUDO
MKLPTPTGLDARFLSTGQNKNKKSQHPNCPRPIQELGKRELENR